MRKKSGFTIVEQAIVLVPEFENVVRKPDQQLILKISKNHRSVHSIYFVLGHGM